MNPIWKQAAIVLVAILVTGATAWLTFGGDKVTETELKEREAAIHLFIEGQISKASAESDYSRDKALLRDQLDTLRSAVRSLSEQVQVIVSIQSDAAADRKITNAKLDALSAQVGTMSAKLDESLRRIGK